ncbi:MAG: extracellular solute-binding protein [Collinsella aerofaciens]
MSSSTTTSRSSTCISPTPLRDPSQLASKTGDDATNEFVTGKAVFYQNGSWAYSDLVKAGMTDDQIGMMPIYIGVDGEENQGLCSGGENYWCVSSQASEDAQKATEDFMYWCVTADTPTSIIADKMGLTAPFKSAKETTNVFSQQAVAMAKDGKKTVAWDFVYIPSEEWKKNLKQALIAYAADNSKWDGVKNAFVDGWKTEKAASE